MAHLALSLYRPINFKVDVMTDGVRTAYGLIGFIMLILGAVAAVDVVRRHHYEVFNWLHYLVWVGIIMVVLHLPLTNTGWPEYALVFIHLAVPVILYLIDQITRWVYNHLLPTTTQGLKPLPGGVTKLIITTHPWASRWQESSFYLINIPHISTTEWHPFSVCGDTHGNNLSFRIKDVSDTTTITISSPSVMMDGGSRSTRNVFTHRVAELAEEISSGRTPLSSTKVHIQGPYGRLSIRIEDYHHILLVGGGIGVTPLTSTLEVIKQKSLQGRMPQLKMVELVWVVRSVEQLSWFAEYLGTLLASFITTTSTTTNSNGGEKTLKARAYNDNARGLEMMEVKEDAQHRPSSSLQSPPWVMLMNVTFQVGTYLPTDLLTSTSSEWFVCSRIDCQSCTAQINQPV